MRYPGGSQGRHKVAKISYQFRPHRMELEASAAASAVFKPPALLTPPAHTDGTPTLPLFGGSGAIGDPGNAQGLVAVAAVAGEGTAQAPVAVPRVQLPLQIIPMPPIDSQDVHVPSLPLPGITAFTATRVCQWHVAYSVLCLTARTYLWLSVFCVYQRRRS